MRRGRRSALVLAGVGVLLLGGAAFGGTSPRGDDPVVVTLEGHDSTLEVTWTGDTFIGDGASSLIEEHGPDHVFEDVASLLGGDVVIVNAEAPITTLDQPFMPYKPYSYASNPDAADAMARAGVHVLGLANNHAMDQGEEGLIDTMDHAAAAGLATFGAGIDDRQAERPLLLQGNGYTVAVVALAKGYGTSVTAGMGRAGTIPFSDASIARGHRLAKSAGADHVVAYVHWGRNYSAEPIPDQRREAERFAAAGYDLVIGHGPHVMQGVELIGSMPVVHSLGNFVFGAPGRFQDEGQPGYGLIADTVFGPAGLEEVRLTCIVVDNRLVDYQPTGCDDEEAARVLGGLGVPVRVDGITATLDLDAANRG
jgi:poly-gamma-glutamate capsule biosynthesis protein CapA/YwtB (metallophosphatase superfamily)